MIFQDLHPFNFECGYLVFRLYILGFILYTHIYGFGYINLAYISFIWKAHQGQICDLC